MAAGSPKKGKHQGTCVPATLAHERLVITPRLSAHKKNPRWHGSCPPDLHPTMTGNIGVEPLGMAKDCIFYITHPQPKVQCKGNTGKSDGVRDGKKSVDQKERRLVYNGVCLGTNLVWCPQMQWKPLTLYDLGELYHTPGGKNSQNWFFVNCVVKPKQKAQCSTPDNTPKCRDDGPIVISAPQTTCLTCINLDTQLCLGSLHTWTSLVE